MICVAARLFHLLQPAATLDFFDRSDDGDGESSLSGSQEQNRKGGTSKTLELQTSF